MAIVVNLDVMMAKRKIGLMELADKMGITPANLSILKNNKAKPLGSRRWTRSAGSWTASPEIFWSIRRIDVCKALREISIAFWRTFDRFIGFEHAVIFLRLLFRSVELRRVSGGVRGIRADLGRAVGRV